MKEEKSCANCMHTDAVGEGSVCRGCNWFNSNKNIENLWEAPQATGIDVNKSEEI